MVRHGFSQLRYTSHSILWGFKEFRFSLPHQDKLGNYAKTDEVKILRNSWENLKREVLAAYPGLKLKTVAKGSSGDRPQDVDSMSPVVNPEDLLDNGGTTGVDSDAMNVAGVGSIPTPPVTLPTSTVPIEEERPVPKTRKQTKFDKPCPECGRDDLKTQLSMGIHLARGHGWSRDKIHKFYGKDEVTPVAKEKRKGVTAIVNNDNNYGEAIEAFETSSKGLTTILRALLSERDFYKKERDAEAGRMAALRDILNPKPNVHRH